jgi:putative ABC transport system substrate-binding protein
MKRRDLLLLGGTMTVARDLRAQQKTIPVIGWLSGSSVGPYAWNMAAFRQGLSETGYVEGQNVAIEIWAEGRADRLPELAADLVGRKVSVIVAQGGNRHLRQKTRPRLSRSSFSPAATRSAPASSLALTGRAATSPA